MDKVKRTDREVEVREDPKKERVWKPAALLPEFTQKPGWVYRWVRVSLLNEPDNMNVSSKMRDGWEPVLHSEHPELIPVLTSRTYKTTILKLVVYYYVKLLKS